MEKFLDRSRREQQKKSTSLKLEDLKIDNLYLNRCIKYIQENQFHPYVVDHCDHLRSSTIKDSFEYTQYMKEITENISQLRNPSVLSQFLYGNLYKINIVVEIIWDYYGMNVEQWLIVEYAHKIHDLRILDTYRFFGCHQYGDPLCKSINLCQQHIGYHAGCEDCEENCDETKEQLKACENCTVSFDESRCSCGNRRFKYDNYNVNWYRAGVLDDTHPQGGMDVDFFSD
jgi:hypothetical protein